MAPRTIAALVSVFVLSACGSAKSDRTFDSSGGASPPGDGTGISGPRLGGGGGTDGGTTAEGGNDGCPPSATLVYVTGSGDQLYSFYPPTQSFTLIGKFDCLTSPTHMTVDR